MRGGAVGARRLLNVRVTFFLRCRETVKNVGDRVMSAGVNTETGVWRWTLIRFINQPMLFSLLWDCCKTLDAN